MTNSSTLIGSKSADILFPSLRTMQWLSSFRSSALQRSVGCAFTSSVYRSTLRMSSVVSQSFTQPTSRHNLVSSVGRPQLTRRWRSSHKHGDDGQRKVLVIYTGGTMGMRRNEQNRLQPKAGYLTKEILQMEELKASNMPHVDVMEYDPIIDSSDMTPEDWKRVVLDIEQNYFRYDGFVIIIGTDTLAYAASAFSFMLENLGKTVVMTGSMIPLCEVFTDARRNLLISLLIAANVDVPEVCVFFNFSLFRGNRCVKVSSTTLDAFSSPNFPPLATLGVGLAIDQKLIRHQPRHRFRANTELGPMPLVVKMTPGCSIDFVLRALEAKAKEEEITPSVVLELFGTGNFPARQQNFFDALRSVKKAGVLIVAASQCHRGAVDMSTYEVSSQMRECGAISAHDMTTMAATTKLAYLLGKNLSTDEINHWMERNLRGELSPTTEFSDVALYRTSDPGLAD